MTKILTILWKEIKDNLRDRRSLFFALLYGPLLLPAISLGPMVYSANKNTADNERPRALLVYGMEQAPNLIRHLTASNFNVRPAPENFEEQLQNGDINFVMTIAATYGARFIDGKPARVTLHFDQEVGQSQLKFRTVRQSLREYSARLSSQRMQARGFDNKLLNPIDIVENDLSEEDGFIGTLANMTMFLLVFPMMMGAFYLAIDTTAGERERKSLEPLLSLPVSRLQIASGKYLAILVFVIVSYILPLIGICIWVNFIPETQFAYADIPTISTFMKIGLLTLPVCFLMAGFLMFLATNAKSAKEAQTQLGFATIIPLIPLFITQLMDIKVNALTSLIPILSQFLLAKQTLLGSALQLAWVLPSLIVTMVVSVLFVYIVARLYNTDRILG